MNGITSLSPQQLRKAADIQERIQTLLAELNEVLGSPAESIATEAPKNGRRKRRRMSAAGRAAIAAAARAKWARLKGTPAPEEHARRKGRKLSAQGLANIRAGVAKRMAAQGRAVQKPKIRRSAAWRAAVSAAAKARWAKAKRAGKSRW